MSGQDKGATHNTYTGTKWAGPYLFLVFKVGGLSNLVQHTRFAGAQSDLVAYATIMVKLCEIDEKSNGRYGGNDGEVVEKRLGSGGEGMRRVMGQFI